MQTYEELHELRGLDLSLRPIVRTGNTLPSETFYATPGRQLPAAKDWRDDKWIGPVINQVESAPFFQR